MKFENFPGFNKPAENKKKDEDEGFDPGRRALLKGVLAFGAAVVAEKTVEAGLDAGKKTGGFLRRFFKEEVPATPEQEEIEEADAQSIAEILSFDNDIELNNETKAALEQYWYESYRDKPGLNESYRGAYQRMKPYRDSLEKIFTREGVPKEFIYLAIPESHWQENAKSNKGAKGPYQFTWSTGEKYGLTKKGSKKDLRSHPLESGRACAELLKDLFDKSNSWDMALSGYNGGFFWDYLKSASKRSEKIDYEGFLKFLETKIKNEKDEINSRRTIEARAGHGAKALENLAKKFNVSPEEILHANGIRNTQKIRAGQVLKIPITSRKAKEAAYNVSVAGFSENINYPAKFNAIIRLLKEDGVIEESYHDAVAKR